MKALMVIPGYDHAIPCDIEVHIWQDTAMLIVSEDVEIPKNSVVNFSKDKNELRSIGIV